MGCCLSEILWEWDIGGWGFLASWGEWWCTNKKGREVHVFEFFSLYSSLVPHFLNEKAGLKATQLLLSSHICLRTFLESLAICSQPNLEATTKAPSSNWVVSSLQLLQTGQLLIFLCLLVDLPLLSYGSLSRIGLELKSVGILGSKFRFSIGQREGQCWYRTPSSTSPTCSVSVWGRCPEKTGASFRVAASPSQWNSPVYPSARLGQASCEPEILSERRSGPGVLLSEKCGK